MKKFFAIVALVCLMVACAPSTKQEYLEEYKAFIEEVSAKASSYTESDWADKTAKFEKFSVEWYEKFKDELSLGEQMQVTAYAASFGYLKSDVDDFVNDLVDDVKDGLNEAGKKAGAIWDDIATDFKKGYEDATKDLEEEIEEEIDELTEE